MKSTTFRDDVNNALNLRFTMHYIDRAAVKTGKGRQLSPQRLDNYLKARDELTESDRGLVQAHFAKMQELQKSDVVKVDDASLTALVKAVLQVEPRDTATMVARQIVKEARSRYDGRVQRPLPSRVVSKGIAAFLEGLEANRFGEVLIDRTEQPDLLRRRIANYLAHCQRQVQWRQGERIVPAKQFRMQREEIIRGLLRLKTNSPTRRALEKLAQS